MRNYLRVLPRDAFNEAKLLNCFGLLALMIHNGTVPCEMNMEEHNGRFDIQLDVEDDCLYVANYAIRVKGVDFAFGSAYNKRDKFPFFVYPHTDDHWEVRVFDEDGTFTTDFIEWTKTIKPNE